MSYTQETTIVDGDFETVVTFSNKMTTTIVSGEPLLSKHQEIVRVCIEDFMKNNIN